MHDGEHATLHDARAYIEGIDDLAPAAGSQLNQRGCDCDLRRLRPAA